MSLQVFIGVLMLTVASCQNQQPEIPSKFIETNVNSAIVSKPEGNNVPDKELVEFFSDDTNIGLPRRNKIEVSNFKKSDGAQLNSNLVVIKFYSLGKNREWKLTQTFEFEKDDLLGCDPKIEDFNNDGLKDITYVSTVAARGANEVRRLFIYDKKSDALIYIKNSEDYPNMLYNEKLDCIDAWLFHSSTTTVFLKLDGDNLREFATVETGLDRTIHLIDKKGKRKLLRTDKIKEEDIYVRYKNFNPPELYE